MLLLVRKAGANVLSAPVASDSSIIIAHSSLDTVQGIPRRFEDVLCGDGITRADAIGLPHIIV